TPIIVQIGAGLPRPVVVGQPTATRIRSIQRREPGRDGKDGAGALPAHRFGWGDAPRTVFTAPRAGVLTLCRIQYTEAFSDMAATVIVGTPAAPAAAMPAEWNRPAS